MGELLRQVADAPVPDLRDAAGRPCPPPLALVSARLLAKRAQD